ncbi:MAG: hypothetical protein NVS4B3_28210 [Gemmatimonadaceae bacterium]
MNAIARILVRGVAVEHLGFLALEMFFWTSPYALRSFKMTPDFIASRPPFTMRTPGRTEELPTG